MDTEHLTAVCTGLGSLREDANGRDVYVKHEDCLVNLKHLQRFLRREDPVEREIFMQLGKWNTIRQDVLPIIIHYRDDYDLVLNAVKVMVFLSMPIDPSSTDIPRQLEYLRQFKEVVLEDDAIGVIVSHLEDPLENMESGTLSDMDGKMFQLVLTLIRNLLAVDDPSSPLVRASLVDGQQALYVKDALIERLFTENVMDLLLALTQHVGGEQPFLRHDNLLILEILNYLLAGQTPDVIASAREKVHKKPEGQSSGAVLEALMHKERQERRHRSFGGPRHSNFCGMFVRVGKDGTQTILTRNPYQSPLDNLFQKPEIKRGLVKKVATDLPSCARSNSTVCSFLRGFADQILEGSYNLLMQTIKSDIRSERNNVQSQDIVMYFAVANFFTAYQRCLLMKKPNKDVQLSGESQNATEDSGAVFQGQCGRIASTMDEDMFVLVTMKWQAFVEDAKLTNEWLPVTSSGALLKEMIHMLDYILKASDLNTSKGQQEVRVARILLYKVFYDQTENGILPFIFRLMKTFDIHKQPRSQLGGLIETTHIVLRLLDSITKQDGALRVKKKARSTKKKNSKLPQNKTSEAPESAGEGVGHEEANAAASSEDHVRPEVSNVADAAASSEGHGRLEVSNVNTPVLDALQSNTNLTPAGDGEVSAQEGRENYTEEIDNEDVEEKEKCEREDSEDDSEEEGEEMRTKEETLDVHKCVRMFADNTILHNYCWLLKNYLHNSPAINYYIVRMLQRICEDLMMEPMLYQLSILQTCYEILSNRSIRNSDQHQFVIAFLTKLVRHLFEKLKTSPMLFVDLLFWKSKQDCHVITANYAIHDLKEFNRGPKPRSKEGTGQDRRSLMNSLGDDDDDDVGNNAHGQARRALLNSLGDDDDDDDAEMPSVETLFRSMDSNKEKGKVKRQKAVKKKGPFTDFEDDLIKDLFKRFKESRSCSKLIAEGLEEAGAVQESGEPFTPAQVGRALKRMGLARVVGKNATANELLRNIRSQSDSEHETGSDKEGDGQQTDAGEINDLGSRSDEEMSDDEDKTQDGVIKNDAVTDEDMSLKASSKKRKSGGADAQGGTVVLKRTRRTGLFSEEQDHELQSLFEKYKGMTRFKHLIVHDLDGGFTTAQIGRRLQQLGCVEPRKRKSKLARMSDDEGEVQRSSGAEQKSGGEIGRGESSEGEGAELPLGSALKASWGPSARKSAQVRKSTATGQRDTPRADSSDDDLPIALHPSMKSAFQKKKTLVENGSLHNEQVLQLEVGSESIAGEGAGDEALLSKQPMSIEGESPELQVQSEQELLGDDPNVQVTEKDDSIEESVAEVAPMAFERRPQSGNESILLIDSEMDKFGESHGGEDEQIVFAKRTYERKRPSVEQKMKSSTWGDSETDASDIEDTQDLATALQEVRIFENQRASKLKKRRLERKQTLSNGQVDGAEEVGADGDPSDDLALETPLQPWRSARKAPIDFMTSDDDE